MTKEEDQLNSIDDSFEEHLHNLEEFIRLQYLDINKVYAILGILAHYEPIHTIKVTVDSIIYRHRVIITMPDASFIQRYNDMKTNNPSDFNNEIHQNPQLIEEYKENLYDIYAKRGLEYNQMFFKYFNIQNQQNHLVLATESPEACDLILESYRTLLRDFQEELDKLGIQRELHMGLYWYNKALLYFATGDGEQAYRSLILAERDDIRTFGSSPKSTNMVDLIINALCNKFNQISTPSQHNIRPTLFSDLLGDADLRDKIELLISLSFGLTHIPSSSIKLHLMLDEFQFRLFFVTLESTLRKITEDFIQQNQVVVTRGGNPFTWESLAFLAPGKPLWSATTNAGSQVPDLYQGSTYSPTANTRGLTPQLQHQLLVNVLGMYPPSFDAGYAYELSYLARNIYLHNFVNISQLNQDQIRSVLKQCWAFLSHLFQTLT